jgi:hypothetical protein
MGFSQVGHLSFHNFPPLLVMLMLMLMHMAMVIL